MRLWRSIGEPELMLVLRGIPVLGRYNNATEVQNSDNHHNVICCFRKNFKWHNAAHKFDIVLDIPDDDVLNKYYGTYYVSKNTLKTGVWSGRTGKETLILEEAVIEKYGLENVVEIHGTERYADWFFNEYVMPVLKTNGIKSSDKRITA